MEINCPHWQPNESVEKLLEEFSACTEFGNLLRRAVASQSLDSLKSAEEQLSEEVTRIDAIPETLKRASEAHRFRMDFLVRFGVTPEELSGYRTLLEEASKIGSLTPREAAMIAHVRSQSVSTQRNGSFSSAGFDSVASASMTV